MLIPDLHQMCVWMVGVLGSSKCTLPACLTDTHRNYSVVLHLVQNNCFSFKLDSYELYFRVYYILGPSCEALMYNTGLEK